MANEEKIAKGRYHLNIRAAKKYKAENERAGLLKIPLEALHNIALQQIGEQESYIEELERQIKILEARLKERDKLIEERRKENKKLAAEIRREKEYAKIQKKYEESQQQNAKLFLRIKMLADLLCQKNQEIDHLQEQLLNKIS